MSKVPMKIGTRVGIGILVIIAIMLSLTIAGLSYMFQVNMRMKGIVENINAKMEMAHVMQNTLRERSLRMYYMIVVKDDFLKDEEWQRFNLSGFNSPPLGAKAVERQRLGECA